MEHKCVKEEIIDIVREDVREIKGDVKLLVAESNKRIGVIYVVSFISSVLVALATSYISSGRI